MRKVQKNIARRRKIKRIIIATCILSLFLSGFVLIYAFRIKNITITGCERYTEDEIKDMLLEKTKFDNSLLLYINYKYFDQEEIPLIEYIDVELKNRNSIEVQVYEKAIFGCVEYMGEYFYFDKDGIIVDSSNERTDGVPIIKGIIYDKIILGQKLEIKQDELFNEVKDLAKLVNKYKLAIDTIYFDPSNEITLFSNNIKILLGHKEMYDEQIAELQNMLPKIEGKKGTLHMENFSTGNKTYFEVSK
jgi:cell division protein FtsQ